MSAFFVLVVLSILTAMCLAALILGNRMLGISSLAIFAFFALVRTAERRRDKAPTSSLISSLRNAEAAGVGHANEIINAYRQSGAPAEDWPVLAPCGGNWFNSTAPLDEDLARQACRRRFCELRDAAVVRAAAEALP